MKNKLVSFIVPVYNAEKYLKICVDSILKQTYQNIEIILVNDGSTDNSQKIIDEYKEAFPYKIVSVIKENSGVADARNVGLNIATGDFIVFSDNDDYMEPDYLETLVNANDNDYDIVIGGYQRVTYDGKVLFLRKYLDKKIAPYLQIAIWGKLYNTSFLKANNIKLPKDLIIGDDLFFSTLAYSKTDKIKVVESTKYHWLFNDKSLSNTDSKNLNRAEDLIQTLEKIKSEVTPNDKEILEYFYLRTTIYYLLFSCKKVSTNKINTSYTLFSHWIEKNIDNGWYKNKYASIFNRDGELLSVKFVVFVFLILNKLHIIKPFLYLYSKM